MRRSRRASDLWSGMVLRGGHGTRRAISVHGLAQRPAARQAQAPCRRCRLAAGRPVAEGPGRLPGVGTGVVRAASGSVGLRVLWGVVQGRMGRRRTGGVRVAVHSHRDGRAAYRASGAEGRQGPSRVASINRTWRVCISECPLPAPRSADGREQCLSALRALDIRPNQTTTHGFRAMTKAILEEVLGFRPDLIEHQLAYTMRDPNGMAYNRTAFLPESRRMMQEWAD